jgi:hypothetical protein
MRWSQSFIPDDERSSGRSRSSQSSVDAASRADSPVDGRMRTPTCRWDTDRSARCPKSSARKWTKPARWNCSCPLCSRWRSSNAPDDAKPSATCCSTGKSRKGDRKLHLALGPTHEEVITDLMAGMSAAIDSCRLRCIRFRRSFATKSDLDSASCEPANF